MQKRRSHMNGYRKPGFSREEITVRNGGLVIVVSDSDAVAGSCSSQCKSRGHDGDAVPISRKKSTKYVFRKSDSTAKKSQHRSCSL